MELTSLLSVFRTAPRPARGIVLLLATSLGGSVTGCRAGAPHAREPHPEAAPVEIAERALARFGAADVPLLRRHVASSARWRLAERDGVLYAFRREKLQDLSGEEGKLKSTSDGFYFRHQPWRRFRTVIRFAGDPAPLDPEWRGEATVAEPGAYQVAARLTRAESGDLESYLVMPAGNGLALEIMEGAIFPGREMTRQILREVNEELEQVLEQRGVLEKQGYLPGAAPAASTRTGPASVSAEPDGDAGNYQVTGYVNPGEPGSVYARAVDPQTGAPILPERIREQTLERVGWSAEPQRKFFFSSRVRAAAPEGEALGGARWEAWFRPESGGPERKVAGGVGEQ